MVFEVGTFVVAVRGSEGTGVVTGLGTAVVGSAAFLVRGLIVVVVGSAAFFVREVTGGGIDGAPVGLDGATRPACAAPEAATPPASTVRAKAAARTGRRVAMGAD